MYYYDCYRVIKAVTLCVFGLDICDDLNTPLRWYSP